MTGQTPLRRKRCRANVVGNTVERSALDCSGRWLFPKKSLEDGIRCSGGKIQSNLSFINSRFCFWTECCCFFYLYRQQTDKSLLHNLPCVITLLVKVTHFIGRGQGQFVRTRTGSKIKAVHDQPSDRSSGREALHPLNKMVIMYRFMKWLPAYRE